MDSLLSDWCAFCEGKAIFDKSHFLGLLKAHNSTEELQHIFGYFSFAEELISRVGSVISSGRLAGSLYLLPKYGATKDELVKLGGSGSKSKKKPVACLVIPKFLRFAITLKYVLLPRRSWSARFNRTFPIIGCLKR